MKRQIIHIDQEKCNGCGACAAACHGSSSPRQSVPSSTSAFHRFMTTPPLPSAKGSPTAAGTAAPGKACPRVPPSVPEQTRRSPGRDPRDAGQIADAQGFPENRQIGGRQVCPLEKRLHLRHHWREIRRRCDSHRRTRPDHAEQGVFPAVLFQQCGKDRRSDADCGGSYSLLYHKPNTDFTRSNSVPI